MCIGLFVMALGSSLVYQADLGNGSIGTMVDGVYKTLHVSRGTADIIVSLILLSVVVIFREKGLINIGTVIALLFTGFSIDFWKAVLLLIPEAGMTQRVIYYILGSIIGAAGTGFYIAVNIGVSAYDAYCMTLYRRTKWEYKYAKILADALMMLAGIVLGGTIGICTIISIISGAYLTQFFIKRSTRLLKKEAILTD